MDEVCPQYIPGNFVLFAYVTPYALGDDLLLGKQVKPIQRICGVRKRHLSTRFAVKLLNRTE